MKGRVVVYIDAKGFEHYALVRAVNVLHAGFVTLAYIDESAPEGDNVVTAFEVAHMDHPSKQETNPELPQIHLHCWKEPYRVHGKQQDRPTIEELEEILNSEDKVDVAINPDGSVTSLPSVEDLDAVADEQKAAEATGAGTDVVSEPAPPSDVEPTA